MIFEPNWYYTANYDDVLSGIEIEFTQNSRNTIATLSLPLSPSIRRLLITSEYTLNPKSDDTNPMVAIAFGNTTIANRLAFPNWNLLELVKFYDYDYRRLP